MYVARLSRRSLGRTTLRYYSTPSTSTNGKKAATAPPQSAAKPGSKIKLQPAPVKPSSLSASSSLPKRRSPLSSSESHKNASPVSASSSSSKSLQPVSSEAQPNSRGVVAWFHTLKQQTLDDLDSAYADGTFPPRKENSSTWAQAMYTTWNLAKFYYYGVRLIVVRQRDSLRIRRRVRKGGEPLTRTEHRMITTQKRDVLKVLPFALAALVLEEIIPFIAITAPSTLPSTCLLPRQYQRITSQRDQEAQKSAKSNLPVLRQLRSQAAGDVTFPQLRKLENAPQAFCSLLRLPTFGPNFMRLHRVSKHLTYIAADDRLLQSESNGSRLSSSEVDQALRERGFLLSQVPSAERLKRLQQWLRDSDRSEDDTTRRLALVVRGQ